MLILTLRTDRPESEIGLFQEERQIDYKVWEAHRKLAETIHNEIAKVLQAHGKDWENLEGIVIFKGPGSYTGLRIGMSVANALAATIGIPIVATNDKAWQHTGIQKLMDNQDEKLALPEYGAEAFTTSPKK